MQAPPDEGRRLEALRRYAILDTPPEPVFDRIAWLAAHHFHTPIASVGFVDGARQWFKSVLGLDVREVLRDVAFCDRTIAQESVLVVPNALTDPLFGSNPLVTGSPGLRFYAGAPVTTRDGFRLGTVSVMDYQPRPDLDADERLFLSHLADLVVEELELRLAADEIKTEIDARERIELELRRTSKKFRLALAHSPVILFHQDRDLRYTWIANAPADQFLGKTDDEIWPPEVAGAMTMIKRTVLDTGQRLREEMTVGPPENRRSYDTTLEPLVEDDRIVGLAGVAMDVTELRNAKNAVSAALAKAEKAERARTRLFAATSHDLRQPMQSLVLMLGVLRERLANTPHVKVVRAARAAAEAMGALLDDILDLSRIEAGEVNVHPRAFPCRRLIERLTADYQPRARAKGLRFRTIAGQCSLVSDPILLERILRNLIENALRYTDRGGILVGCHRRGTRLRIEVVDTGVGLAPEHQQTIFDEFVQLHSPERERAKGMGLGLAIVKRLSELLDHPLGVRSELGKGSRFTIDVPTADPSPAADDNAPVQGRMLVIDDERMVLDALALTLRGWGIDVVTADSTEEAMKALEGQQPPDAILADYRLRGGVTGVDAIDAVRGHFKTFIPGVLITGDTSPRRLAEAKASGHLLLHKPVAAAELRGMVSRILPHGP